MKTILFDLDGTLTDPREGITRSIAYALEQMGVAPPPLDRLVFAIGPPLRGSLGQLLGTDSRDAIEKALAHYRVRFADVGLFENTAYEQIAETLAALRRTGATLFVATSKPRVYAERIVRHFGLDPHFEAVHGCELDGTREAKRDLLEHLIATHALDRSRTAMIGDRDVDMVAARHHGLWALGVTYGYGGRDELLGAGAHALCDAPADIPAALRNLAIAR